MKNNFYYLAFSLIIVAVCVATIFTQTKKIPEFIEVPFEFHRNSVIIQVKVNGKDSVNMLLDTGTSPSAIDITTAKKMNLKIKKINVGGKGTGDGEIVSYQTMLPLIQVGAVTAKNVETVAVEELSQIGVQLGKPIDGVLGYSFLKNRIVQIDYKKQVVRFYTSAPYLKKGRQSPNRIILPFRLLDDTPLIEEVYINGKNIRATLDTGSSGTIRLTATATKTLGLDEFVRNSESVSVTGFAGKTLYRKGQLNSFSIGKFIQNGVAATFITEKKAGEKNGAEANIGNAIFSNYVVTFDYRKSLVVFEKN